MKVSIRPLEESDLPAADHVFRLAFGTFLGLPEPLTFGGDSDHVRTRWSVDPLASLGAEVDGELVASNFAANWGSIGLFGPLTVRPDLWDKSIAKRLLEPTMEIFAGWGIKHAGLFSHPESTKHIGLYQKFGFWPRFLTAIMSKPVRETAAAEHWSRYSEIPEGGREERLTACRRLTGLVYEGLDLEREIRTVHSHGFGDTLLLWEDTSLAGLAVCHCGAGTQAGSGMCYVKFGAVRPGPEAGRLFERLLDACEALAAERGMSRLVAGVNTARHEAYRKMLARGFRTDIQGVTMHKPNEPAYNRHDAYVIDDWR